MEVTEIAPEKVTNKKPQTGHNRKNLVGLFHPSYPFIFGHLQCHVTPFITIGFIWFHTSQVVQGFSHQQSHLISSQHILEAACIFAAPNTSDTQKPRHYLVPLGKSHIHMLRKQLATLYLGKFQPCDLEESGGSK